MPATIANPAQIAEKWASRLGAAGQAYKDGIERVQENPLEKAAQAGQAWIEGCQRSEQKRQSGLRRVSMQDWKNAAINKGAARLASGATAAKNKYQQFLTDFMPHLRDAQMQVDSMPRGSFENNMARCNRMAELLHQYKRS